jgi:hypothetical protein
MVVRGADTPDGSFASGPPDTDTATTSSEPEPTATAANDDQRSNDTLLVDTPPKPHRLKLLLNQAALSLLFQSQLNENADFSAVEQAERAVGR